MSTGRDLHQQAAKAREAERFEESLDFNDKALFAYDADSDDLGFSEGIACRSITLRVYAELHKSTRLLILAKHEMMAAVEIARRSGQSDALALPLYNLAKLHEALSEFKQAVPAYTEAVAAMEKNPPTSNNRPAVLADMRVHMAACECKAGIDGALVRLKVAVADLEAAQEPDQYNRDVWVSGGYMKLAEATHKVDSAASKEYLDKAASIINTNPALTLRKKQLDALTQTLL